MPSEHLLFENSQSQSGDAAWIEWYKNERLPDVVNSGTSSRASVYRETHDFALAPAEKADRNFLALYQTGFEEPLKSKAYTESAVPTRTKLIEGDVDSRNYKVIQDFNPKGLDETPSPFILTIEMEPQPANEADFEKWYREEHLLLLRKLPGYRRCTRYVIGPEASAIGSQAAKYLAIHEVDSLKTAYSSVEAESANTTAWTVKQVEESKVFIARGWELVDSLGW